MENLQMIVTFAINLVLLALTCILAGLTMTLLLIRGLKGDGITSKKVGR